MDHQKICLSHPLLVSIAKIAKRRNIATYLVGGFVRDTLLARSCSDIDLLCLGDAALLAQDLAAKTPAATLSIFRRFGTAMVRTSSWQVEFVRARKESYPPDSRKPLVEAATLEEDLLRRDATINTLAISLFGDDHGKLVDCCGGGRDLKKRLLRTPRDPQKTFSDDPLRMLRLIRFAVQLDFQIEPATFAAIEKTAFRINLLSKERIVEELNKILSAPAPDKGFYLLERAGLLAIILPELVALKGVETRMGKSHKDNFIHTLQVLANVAQKSPHLWLRWAALMHDIAKPSTKRFDPQLGFTFHGHEWLGAKMVVPIFRRLGLPMRAQMRYVQKLVRLHLRHIPLVEKVVSDAAIRRFVYDAGEELEDLIILCRADITSGNPRKVARYLANFECLAAKIKEVAAKDEVRNFQPVIDGQAIMSYFKIPPSREVGILKSSLKEAILDGHVDNQPKAAWAFILKQAKELGLCNHSSRS